MLTVGCSKNSNGDKCDKEQEESQPDLGEQDPQICGYCNQIVYKHPWEFQANWQMRFPNSIDIPLFVALPILKKCGLPYDIESRKSMDQYQQMLQ